MFKTIRARLTLWYIALLALILIAFSAALYFTLARSLYQQVDNTLRLNAEQLAGAVNIEQGQINFQNSEGDTSDAASLRESGYLVRLVDAGGRIVDTNARFAALAVSSAALDAARAGQAPLDTRAVNGQPYRIYTRPISENGIFYGALQIAQPLDEVDSALRQLLVLLLAIVPLTLALASGGGYWFAQRALAPMDRITRAARRISAADLHQRLNLNLPDDEVGRLARTFDAMLARLDDAFRREREFTANASHELRTPLTVMRGEIDVTLNRPRTPDEYRRVLQELGGDVDRLTQRAGDLLMLARADAGKLPLQFDAVSTARLLHAVADEMRALAEERGVALVVRADDRDHPAAGSGQALGDALTLWADEDKLLHVLFNLVENALKFTPRGGTVTLAAARAGDRTELSIADTGIGIAPEQLPHIFERFYRADDQEPVLSQPKDHLGESRTSDTGGAGLGLAIVRALVVAQGGTIEAQSVVGQGTTFVVRMPLKERK